ncbi:hypothetical protein WA171_001662 [Blastocystis sp. BT1]
MAIYTQDEWRPLFIIVQIIANQCWFYAIWMTIHYMAALLLRMPTTFSISFFFTDYEFNIVDMHFYLIILELTITCFIMVPIVVYIAERAKKCFDFCSTIFIIHLFICICFYVSMWILIDQKGIPLNFYWWGTMLCCMIGLTLLTERVSARRELQDILVEDILETV